jgi:hypothetical protein
MADDAPIKTYFIQAVNGGPIKIGRSSNPGQRLKDIQTGQGARLEILGVLNGDHERELQRRFRRLRVSGEWFRCETHLVEYLLTHTTLTDEHRTRLISEARIHRGLIPPPTPADPWFVYAARLAIVRDAARGRPVFAGDTWIALRDFARPDPPADSAVLELLRRQNLEPQLRQE